ncbi:Serine/threonine-protein kinase tnni3k [Phlyctochytrium planicorne]|nr:Serine/threonine-protein kinase tnni3k [Phlyctochytrium planicorne]
MDGSQYSIVLEYLPQGSLYDFYTSKPLLPFGNRLSLALDIASGMQYLHGLNPPVLHRDVKSLNVLLYVDSVGELHAKLTDFGISAVMKSTLTTTSALNTGGSSDSQKGSLLWMAPELFSLRVIYRPSSDVYSFGIVLTELFSWSGPFGIPLPDLRHEVLHHHLTVKQEIPEIELDESHPNGELLALVTQCCSYDPAARPDFKEILERLGVIAGKEEEPVAAALLTLDGAKEEVVTKTMEFDVVQTSMSNRAGYSAASSTPLNVVDTVSFDVTATNVSSRAASGPNPPSIIQTQSTLSSPPTLLQPQTFSSTIPVQAPANYAAPLPIKSNDFKPNPPREPQQQSSPAKEKDEMLASQSARSTRTRTIIIIIVAIAAIGLGVGVGVALSKKGDNGGSNNNSSSQGQGSTISSIQSSATLSSKTTSTTTTTTTTTTEPTTTTEQPKTEPPKPSPSPLPSPSPSPSPSQEPQPEACGRNPPSTSGDNFKLASCGKCLSKDAKSMVDCNSGDAATWLLKQWTSRSPLSIFLADGSTQCLNVDASGQGNRDRHYFLKVEDCPLGGWLTFDNGRIFDNEVVGCADRDLWFRMETIIYNIFIEAENSSAAASSSSSSSSINSAGTGSLLKPSSTSTSSSSSKRKPSKFNRCTTSPAQVTFLQEIRGRLGKERDLSKKQQWWIPPNPALTTKPSYDAYALKPVFVWDPIEQYPEAFRTVKCKGCHKTGSIKSEGWSNSIRTVYGMKHKVFLISKYHGCTTRDCRIKFSAHDPELFSQFPVHVQEDFPFYLTEKSAITNELKRFIIRLKPKNGVGQVFKIIKDMYFEHFIDTMYSLVNHCKAYEKLSPNPLSETQETLSKCRSLLLGQISCEESGVDGGTNSLLAACTDVNGYDGEWPSLSFLRELSFELHEGEVSEIRRRVVGLMGVFGTGSWDKLGQGEGETEVDRVEGRALAEGEREGDMVLDEEEEVEEEQDVLPLCQSQPQQREDTVVIGGEARTLPDVVLPLKKRRRVEGAGSKGSSEADPSLGTLFAVASSALEDLRSEERLASGPQTPESMSSNDGALPSTDAPRVDVEMLATVAVTDADAQRKRKRPDNSNEANIPPHPNAAAVTSSPAPSFQSLTVDTRTPPTLPSFSQTQQRYVPASPFAPASTTPAAAAATPPSTSTAPILPLPLPSLMNAAQGSPQPPSSLAATFFGPLGVSSYSTSGNGAAGVALMPRPVLPVPVPSMGPSAPNGRNGSGLVPSGSQQPQQQQQQQSLQQHPSTIVSLPSSTSTPNGGPLPGATQQQQQQQPSISHLLPRPAPRPRPTPRAKPHCQRCGEPQKGHDLRICRDGICITDRDAFPWKGVDGYGVDELMGRYVGYVRERYGGEKGAEKRLLSVHRFLVGRVEREGGAGLGGAGLSGVTGV